MIKQNQSPLNRHSLDGKSTFTRIQKCGEREFVCFRNIYVIVSVCKDEKMERKKDAIRELLDAPPLALIAARGRRVGLAPASWQLPRIIPLHPPLPPRLPPPASHSRFPLNSDYPPGRVAGGGWRRAAG